ncbi:unnamed protein product [Parnassius apollo]|uniref:(apollo) hypothetical protein n=1 Tax=Parnassius apollo TaxID=110799 RepID=A0A8S3X4J1_PARAO|nr:unnamed protein product [Parnassius apollo]
MAGGLPLEVNDAWARIAEEMLVPVSEIKRKKETLLAAFRLNHKKVVASLKSGAGEDEVFKPIWVFYDALAAFMIDVYECKSVLVTADKVDISKTLP